MESLEQMLAELDEQGGFAEPDAPPVGTRRVALRPMAPLPAPPPTPAPPGAVGTEEPEGASQVDANGAIPRRDNDRATLSRSSPEGPSEREDDAQRAFERTELLGTAKGHKRLVQVNLPAPTRARLEEVCARGRTRAEAAMDALRASYEWLVQTHQREPEAAASPFPPPGGRRRRLNLVDPRNVPFLFSPEEAAAIATVAFELEVTVSELITLALDHQLAQGSTD